VDNDQKLNGEAEEEEKIEFEKGDINLDVSRYFSIKLFRRNFGMYLVCQVPPLEPQVGADMLVDCPRKFIVKLPCNE